MRSRMNSAFVIALAMVALLVGTVVQAGTISGPVLFTDDAGSDISSSKTYTHLFDFGTPTAAVVNGVTFTPLYVEETPPVLMVSGTNFTYVSTPSVPDQGVPQFLTGRAGNTSRAGVPNGTGMYNMLNDVMYPNGYHDYQTVTLSGLTEGYTYDLRLYYRQWQTSVPRNINLEFDEDGAGPLGSSVVINEDGLAGARYLSYAYTATSLGTLTVKLTPLPEHSWNMYGLSNEQVAVPEPATLTLIGMGLLSLLAYAWRKRK